MPLSPSGAAEGRPKGRAWESAAPPLVEPSGPGAPRIREEEAEEEWMCLEEAWRRAKRWAAERNPSARPGGSRRGGSFAGRGPKGYGRSDERLYEEVCERLMKHPAVDASEIEVVVEEGVVRFRGTVPNRWTKFLAEDLAEGVVGVRDLVNELRLLRY